MVVNYYTGERWYLVTRDGKEMYVSEDEYNQTNTDSQRPEASVQEVPED